MALCEKSVMALGGILLASASTGGASRWRVCYQWGLPRLVSCIIQNPVVSVWYYHMAFFSNVETQVNGKFSSWIKECVNFNMNDQIEDLIDLI